MGSMTRNLKNIHGFTIAEVLVYIGMSALLTAGVMKIYVTNTQISASQKNIAQMYQEIRAAMNMMTTELRRAGCDPLGTNKGRTLSSEDYLGFLDNDNDDHLNTDENSIHFTHDSTEPSDGWPYSINENVAYYCKGATSTGGQNLYRWCEASEQEYLLARNIKLLDFEYFDSEGEAFTISDDSDRAKIRVVKITLTAETAKKDHLSGEKKEQTLTAYVRIRNLNL